LFRGDQLSTLIKVAVNSPICLIAPRYGIVEDQITQTAIPGHGQTGLNIGAAKIRGLASTLSLPCESPPDRSI
jgi:hypothetical protein